MPSTVIAFTRFYCLRWYRAQPLLFSATVLLLILCLVTTGLFLQTLLLQDQAKVALHDTIGELERTHLEKARAEASLAPPVQLPVFQSSSLVNTLNSVATEMQVQLDEVSYTLEERTDRPFFRYQITFATMARYPILKAMIQKLQIDAPHVLLDSVSCAREDIVKSELQCDLVFSAYFKKN
nr:hypothetical protein [uncultured Undibacterium sp.]